MKPLSISDHDAILACLRDAAEAGGRIAAAAFNPGGRTSAHVAYKAGNSPVSDADLAIDRLLRERLSAALPAAAWLSEETADSADRLGHHAVLVVDPIDGTRAFIAGDPRWCVSIALVVDGRPVVGVVEAPALRQQFEAIAGRGARCNGVPIAVSSRASLDGAEIAAPAGVANPLKDKVGFHLVPRIPSLACRFVDVAAGLIDGGIAAGGPHDWDVAAADLILHEAGGRLTDRTGATLLYNRPRPAHPMLVGGPPPIHEALLALLARSGH